MIIVGAKRRKPMISKTSRIDLRVLVRTTLDALFSGIGMKRSMAAMIAPMGRLMKKPRICQRAFKYG